MSQVETGRFTVGVFQDRTWAERGLDALGRQNLPAGSLSILTRDGADLAELIEQRVGTAPTRLEVAGLGPVLAAGPLLQALDPDGSLASQGLARAMKRVGFQEHDGQIFETLTARGGILVAVQSEPRAADALAVFFSYGGANAAIGAWTGRL